MAKTAAQALAAARSALGSPYWYASSGQRPTAAWLGALISGQFKAKWTPERVSKAKREIGTAAHCFDCIGFVRWCAGVEKNVTALNTNADKLRELSQPQPLKTLPETPGVCVFMPGHVGIYAGNGRVIECYNFRCVADRPITAQNWTHWGFCPWIDYGDVKPTIVHENVINKPLQTIAREVCDGRWGNGDERRKRLSQAGYDLAAVQKIVNEIIRKERGGP